MDSNKKQQLEASGWKVSSGDDFLKSEDLLLRELTEVEEAYLDSVQEREAVYRKLAEEKEVTQYYLVKYSSDWADEMDIEGLDILTDSDKQYFESLKPTEDKPLVHYVGTNEEIEYRSSSELLSCYEWISITEQEREIIERLIGMSYGHFFYLEESEEDEDYWTNEEGNNENE